MAEEIISYFDLAKKEGGTIQHGSINIKNLRLLCAKHNLEKSDKIDVF